MKTETNNTPAITRFANVERLLEILTLRRGHGSIGERKLIDGIIAPYAPTTYLGSTGETAAYVITVGNVSTRTLYCCHIDTVHAQTDDAKQLVVYDQPTAMMYKQDGKALGADDGAGVWLLLEMIDAGVPGTYLFCRGEERGCIGSKDLAKLHADFLEQFDRAIAFDRRDTCSVITHQLAGRCCSDEFAEAVSALLSDGIYTLSPDDTGVYTDTAQFTSLISECTNISVGYYNEHGGDELLDVDYLVWLRGRMIECAAGIDAVAATRDRFAVDAESDYGWDWKNYLPQQTYYTTAKSSSKNDRVLMSAEDVVDMRWRELVRYIETAAPEDLADLMLEMAETIVYDRDYKGDGRG